MSRITYVFRDGECIDKRLAPPPRYQRSSLTAPYIRSDGMDAIVNHADGRLYDSKSAYERAVKASGCEIVGNDSSLYRDPTPPAFEAAGVERDVKTVIERLEAGHKPAEIISTHGGEP